MSRLTTSQGPFLTPTLRSWLVLGLIVLASGVLGASLLDRSHNWGDDFASYIMQAQSLVQGRTHEFVLRNTFTISRSSAQIGLISYPWGFPLLLAPVYAVFGIKILAFKFVVTLCYMSFLVAMFGLARRRLSDPEALILTAFMAFNPILLRAQNEILSDLPFLMWSTISLVLVERLVGASPGSRAPILAGIGTGLVIFMAAITRLNGLLLVVPLAVAQFSRLRRRGGGQESWPGTLTVAAVPYVVFAFLYSLQAAILPGSSGGSEAAFASYSWAGLWSGVIYYALLPGDFLQASALGGYGLYALLLPFFALTVWRRRMQDLPLLLYFLATIALYVATPFRAGPRYIYPILPVFFLFAFEGMNFTVTWLSVLRRRLAATAVQLFWAGLAVTSLAGVLRDVAYHVSAAPDISGGPFSAASMEMFGVIRDRTPLRSVVIFFKPRAMRLLTDRDAFQTTNCEDLAEADYVVIMKEGGTDNQISPSRIGSCNPSVDLNRIFGKGGFEVYQIDPAE